jgi:hypothetical protein
VTRPSQFPSDRLTIDSCSSALVSECTVGDEVKRQAAALAAVTVSDSLNSASAGLPPWRLFR